MAGVLYIDESGDPGLNLDPSTPSSGSSELLVIGGVYFPSQKIRDRWVGAHHVWEKDARRVGRPAHKREFKFSRATPRARHLFAKSALAVRGWKWNQIVVYKNDLWGRNGAEDWYRLAIRWLLNNAAQTAQKGTLLRIDTRSFSLDHRSALMRAIAEPTNTARAGRAERHVSDFYAEPRFIDSAESAGIQLADYVAGSATVAFRSWKWASMEWKQHLHQRVGFCQHWPPREKAI